MGISKAIEVNMYAVQLKVRLLHLFLSIISKLHVRDM